MIYILPLLSQTEEITLQLVRRNGREAERGHLIAAPENGSLLLLSTLAPCALAFPEHHVFLWLLLEHEAICFTSLGGKVDLIFSFRRNFYRVALTIGDGGVFDAGVGDLAFAAFSG